MSTEIKAENIKGKNVQIGKHPKLKIGKPAKKAEEKKETPKALIAFSLAFTASDLVALLPLPLNTIAEFEKITGIRDKFQEAIKEYQEKLKEIYEFYGIENQVTESHPKFNEVMEKVNNLFVSASSLEVEDVQVYSREEVLTMAINAKHRDDSPFANETISLLADLLTKKEK